MGNGKAKGSGYERTICKFLTKWLTNKEKPYVWWRSPSSGALATITAQNPNLTGDIISVLPEGHFLTDIFSIEIKNGYPKSSFHKFFSQSKNNEIMKFWNQAKEDIKDNKKEPMLIWKKDRKDPLLFINKYIVDNLLKTSQLNNFIINIKHEQISVFNMKEFFTIVQPSDIIKLKDKKWVK